MEWNDYQNVYWMKIYFIWFFMTNNLYAKKIMPEHALENISLNKHLFHIMVLFPWQSFSFMCTENDFLYLCVLEKDKWSNSCFGLSLLVHDNELLFNAYKNDARICFGKCLLNTHIYAHFCIFIKTDFCAKTMLKCFLWKHLFHDN